MRGVTYVHTYLVLVQDAERGGYILLQRPYSAATTATPGILLLHGLTTILSGEIGGGGRGKALFPRGGGPGACAVMRLGEGLLRLVVWWRHTNESQSGGLGPEGEKAFLEAIGGFVCPSSRGEGGKGKKTRRGHVPRNIKI